MVGVAGSGKTTALDAAATALEAAGYRVLGTSTSGQAARTLGAEAGIEARTFASLLWRLDHGQIALDQRTVVIVDEAGMTADADLARLVARRRARRAPRSCSSATTASSPPSAPAARSPRSSTGTPSSSSPSTRTSANTTPPSATPSPSCATAPSPTAVAWYARERPHPHRTRPASTPSPPWSTPGPPTSPPATTPPCSPGGADDVADLNRLARDRWDQLGHLHGDDV